jgi:heme/copper-type cytochrome/quinol oxidase subunit 3
MLKMDVIIQKYINQWNNLNIWNISTRVSSLYHLVPASGYPLILSFTLLLTILNLINLTDLNITNHGVFFDKIFLSLSLFCFLTSLALWLCQVLKEAFNGDHTKYVLNGLKLGFLLFISSEIMLFFAVFWGWFHINLLNEFIYTESHSTNYLEKIDWYPLPAIGTILLGSSSAFLTESHYMLNWPIFYSNVKNLTNFYKYKYLNSSYRLLRMTCGFGILFLLLQSIEYNLMGYSWRGHIYASLFYTITSLHGSHVFVGLMFLLVCYFRLWANIIYLNILQNIIYLKISKKYFFFIITEIDYILYIIRLAFNKIFNYVKLSEQRHLFFEVSAWYWHFVDIVWLFVFLYVYFWLNGFQYFV